MFCNINILQIRSFFMGVTYFQCFPVVTLIGCNIKCYRGRIQFYKCVRACMHNCNFFKTLLDVRSLIRFLLFIKSSAFNEALPFLVVFCLFIIV